MSPSGSDRQTLNRSGAFILFLCLLASYTSGTAQETDAYCTEVSILTCGPGDRVETAFGHSAIRVKDPAAGTDLVWNFGSFNPKEKGFTLRMLFGRLDYYLTVTPFDRFVRPYVRKGRPVFEQKLSFTPEETRRLVFLLEQTLENGKGAYRYDGQTENCTTKITELLAATLQAGRVERHDQDSRSYRSILTDRMGSAPWLFLFMNISIGLPFDRVPTGPKGLFLPADLSVHLPELTFDGRKLAAGEGYVFNNGNGMKKKFTLGPAVTLLALLVLTAGFSLFLRQEARGMRYFDGILFFMTGSVGLLILLLSLFAGYEATQQNYNLLWLNPLYFLLIFRTTRKRIRWVSLVLLSACLVFTILALLVQDRFHTPVFLLIGILAIRLMLQLRMKGITPYRSSGTPSCTSSPATPLRCHNPAA